MRRTQFFLARRKHFQKGWSPNATKQGAAPPNGVTSQEALQIAYRPMPLDQTVEYEEDFSSNLMIHREFISKKYRTQMSFAMAPVAPSELELKRARETLASTMNRERKGVLLGSAASEADRVHFNIDVDDDTREIRSARYLFSEDRMQYCDRFQQFFSKAIREAIQYKGLEEEPGQSEEQPLFSLMEACAVVYGCETTAVKEAYFRRFLQLDLDSLEEEQEALQQREKEARQLENQRSTRDDALEGVVKRLPSLFEDDDDDDEMKQLNSSLAEEAVLKEREKESVRIPEAYAPLYRALLDYTLGESAVGSYNYDSFSATDRLQERRRWRSVMEKLIAESYHLLTAEELASAVILNHQLHTVKFFDLKVGDTVREIMQFMQREANSGSAHRNTPQEVSVTHPERRV